MFFAVLLLTIMTSAQSQPAAAASSQRAGISVEIPADVAKIVAQQFGAKFKIVDKAPGPVLKMSKDDEVPPWTPLLIADLDGDGVADAVIVVRCKNPLLDAMQFNYKVADPYDAYFGYGDPKVTLQFGALDPDRNLFLLIIHGAGPEGWRAAAPKAKFVIINTPFDRLSVSRFMLKKKLVSAINAEESGALTSAVFWDGKRYRWEPNFTPE